MHSNNKNNISRRRFLGQSCSAMAYTSIFSSLINLKAFAAAAADNSAFPPGDYKALVMVMLNGGNDSFNMLIPRGNTEYAEYQTTRSNLAISQADLLAINPLTSDGRTYGLNPSMPNFQNLFENNKLAFLSNVGTLVAPMTKAQYINGTVERPLGLYSHLDQRMQWQTGRPNERTHKGWGGRVADIIQSMNTNQDISMNISLNGINTFQYGNEVIPYVITADGAISITDWEATDPYSLARKTAMTSIMDQDYYDIYKNTYKNTLKSSNDTSLVFQAAIDAVPSFTTPYPSGNSLAAQLRMVAKTIAARDTLGFSRQIFFVEAGGWDHHAELLHDHGLKLAMVDEALNYFNGVTEELNIANGVTTFSASDFGRTLTSNGNGTDHAWGGNAFMMGGAVNGKDMYGTFPSLALNSNTSLHSRGVVLPTTATDLYFAELAKWFGVSNSDLNLIFPNLSNFYDTSSGVAPVGFMTL